jgi:hypothetical protein
MLNYIKNTIKNNNIKRNLLTRREKDVINEFLNENIDIQYHTLYDWLFTELWKRNDEPKISNYYTGYLIIFIPIVLAIAKYLNFQQSTLSVVSWIICSFFCIIYSISIFFMWKPQMKPHKDAFFIDYKSIRTGVGKIKTGKLIFIIVLYFLFLSSIAFISVFWISLPFLGVGILSVIMRFEIRNQSKLNIAEFQSIDVIQELQNFKGEMNDTNKKGVNANSKKVSR